MLIEQIEKVLKDKNVSKKTMFNDLKLNINSISTWKKRGTIPSAATVERIAEYLDVSVDYLLGKTDEKKPASESGSRKGVKIPVYGTIAAGYPIEAIENVIDYEEITPELASTGEFFALLVKGDSMEPKISSGDIVIIKKQPDVESGQIAAVLINGNEATLKKVVKHNDSLSLISNNSVYQPMTFSSKEVETLPVVILGRAVELRAKM